MATEWFNRVSFERALSPQHLVLDLRIRFDHQIYLFKLLFVKSEKRCQRLLACDVTKGDKVPR